MSLQIYGDLHFLQHEKEDSFFRDPGESRADSQSKYSQSPEDMMWHVHGPQVEAQLREQVGGKAKHPLENLKIHQIILKVKSNFTLFIFEYIYTRSDFKQMGHCH